MKTLPWRCAATIGWVVCLSELDRRSEFLQMGAAGYALGAASVLLLLVPRWRGLSTLWVLSFAFPVFCVLELLTGAPITLRSSFGSLLEFGGSAVTLFLVSRLARGLGLAEEVLREFAIGPVRETPEPFARNQGEMYREVRRARRYERPLSLLAVSASGAQPPAALARLAEQARAESLSRYVSAKLATLLDEETAGSTVIANRGEHFLVLLPESSRPEAEQVAKRLERAAEERHGMRLGFGIASFPHQEITFDKLLETAEAELRATQLAEAVEPPGFAARLASKPAGS
jgi:hypothetical protein